MDQIGLFFKCQSCSDYVLTGNIQCPNGHQVCHLCFENLSHCPTCHQRVAPSTRIPFLLQTNVDPILNVTGNSFDLLLPSLLRIAPALHPCTSDEMIYIGKPKNLNLNSMNNDSNNVMQKNNNIADQLLMANNCGEVEETLSRLMMLASMSSSPMPTPLQTTNNTPTAQLDQSMGNINYESVSVSSSSLNSSTPIATVVNNNNNNNNNSNTNNASVVINTTTNQSIGGLLNNNQHHNIDGFPEF